jgi:hypothetical protein
MKIKAENGMVITSPLAYSQQEVLDVSLAAYKQGAEFDQKSLRELIWALDMMAVTIPDNVNNFWDPKRLTEVSKLRDQYFKRFGERAYDK